MHGRKVLRAARYLFDGRVALCYFMTGTPCRDASAFNHYTIPASRPLRRSSLGGLLDLLAPGLVGVLALRLRALKMSAAMASRGRVDCVTPPDAIDAASTASL